MLVTLGQTVYMVEEDVADWYCGVWHMFQMTCADLMFTVYLHPKALKGRCNVDLDLSAYPKLAALFQRVESHPTIAERLRSIELTDDWLL